MRLVARSVEDPSKLGDIMPVGFGDNSMLDDELAEEGGRRRWDYHGPQWVNKEGKKDGFVSTLTRAVSLLPEGKPLWGGPCQKVEIDEVDVRPTGGKGSDQDPEDPDAWEIEIGKAGRGGAYIFSDGSLLESQWRQGASEAEIRSRVRRHGIGDGNQYWGHSNGMGWGSGRHGRGPTQKVRQGGEQKVLILADSKAAIAAVRKAR